MHHHSSHAQIQIARGLAMNPKKLGEVDKTKASWKLAFSRSGGNWRQLGMRQDATTG